MTYNSGPQPVVLGIVASFSFNFHFMSNTFRIILAVPSKQSFCNISTVISKSSFCIHFSNCFFTVPNAPTTGITSTSFILHILVNFIFQVAVIVALFLFFLFNTSIKWACWVDEKAFLSLFLNYSDIRSVVLQCLVGLYGGNPIKSCTLLIPTLSQACVYTTDQTFQIPISRIVSSGSLLQHIMSHLFVFFLCFVFGILPQYVPLFHLQNHNATS